MHTPYENLMPDDLRWSEEVDSVIVEVRRGTEEVDPVIMELRGGREEVHPVMEGKRRAGRR